MEQIPTDIQDKIRDYADCRDRRDAVVSDVIYGYRLASPCALCEGKEKEIAELKQNHLDWMDAVGRADKLYKQHIEEPLKQRVSELEKVLTGLVNLKDLKDKEGKTEIYLQLQPIAWRQAKELLNNEPEDKRSVARNDAQGTALD